MMSDIEEVSVDIEKLKDDIWEPLKDYTGIPQLMKANQDMPKGQYEYPRILYHFSTKYNQQSNNLIETREVVDSTSEDFDKDIIHCYYLNPQATLTFNGYGNEKGQITEYMKSLAKWFSVNKLGKEWLRENYNCVVREVNDIQDITTVLEQQHEERMNLDVILEFEEIVKVRTDTIEQIEVNRKEINL